LAGKFACQQNYEPSSNHRKIKYSLLELFHQNESNGGKHMPLSMIDQLQIGKRLADQHNYILYIFPICDRFITPKNMWLLPLDSP